jgi:hypothetical protein
VHCEEKDQDSGRATCCAENHHLEIPYHAPAYPLLPFVPVSNRTIPHARPFPLQAGPTHERSHFHPVTHARVTPLAQSRLKTDHEHAIPPIFNPRTQNAGGPAATGTRKKADTNQPGTSKPRPPRQSIGKGAREVFVKDSAMASADLLRREEEFYESLFDSAKGRFFCLKIRWISIVPVFRVRLMWCLFHGIDVLLTQAIPVRRVG